MELIPEPQKPKNVVQGQFYGLWGIIHFAETVGKRPACVRMARFSCTILHQSDEPAADCDTSKFLRVQNAAIAALVIFGAEITKAR